MKKNFIISLLALSGMIFLSGCASGHINGGLVIHTPVEEVFNVVADFRNEPGFNPNMLQVKLETAEPIGAGSRFMARVKSGSDTIDMRVTYTGFKKDEYIGSLSAANNMEVSGGLKFSPVEGGTLLQWSWDVRLSGKLRLFGPLVSMMGKQQEVKIWRGLKDKMEKGK